MGSSLISHLDAYMTAKKQVFKLPLPVILIGQPGLRLHQLRPLVDREVLQAPPAYLVVHAGANDIGTLTSGDWRFAMEEALFYLGAILPHTTIVWSDMLPRSRWRHGASAEACEAARKRNQRRARGVVINMGGGVIRHDWQFSYCHDLHDGVHLSPAGQEKFISSLENGMLSFLS